MEAAPSEHEPVRAATRSGAAPRTAAALAPGAASAVPTISPFGLRSPGQIFSLQRAAGNQTVSRLLGQASQMQRRVDLDTMDGETLHKLIVEKQEIFSKGDQKVIGGGDFTAELVAQAISRM